MFDPKGVFLVSKELSEMRVREAFLYKRLEHLDAIKRDTRNELTKLQLKIQEKVKQERSEHNNRFKKENKKDTINNAKM
jgi:hypothetical protein